MTFGVAAIYRLHHPDRHARAGRSDRDRHTGWGRGVLEAEPRFMKPGDEITIEIDGIGSITNPVTAG